VRAPAFVNGVGTRSRVRRAQSRGWSGFVGDFMRAVLDIVLIILNLYTWVVILGAILSWLIAFGVVNIRNDLVRAAWNLFLALTEPFLRPIRNFLPSTGGVDLSPIVLLLGIMLLQRIIVYYVYPNVF
jgi:YggT family protein